ncbi:hypothetical protein [uncultured Alloprevotella sp.]|uniref:hypothetical protein n=1 Tax=uncultured Alloprevotella sp. TaxID=1283315 RepID=UPI00325FB853
MNEFPKHLLALAFFNLIPALLSVFFLFGGATIGYSPNAILSFLFYFLSNLLWIIPVSTFFFGLNEFRRGYEKRSLALLIGGSLFTIGDILFLILR